MYYIVYKIKNILNGKIYVGIHKTDDINDSYMGSGKNLKLDLKLYGRENFTKEVLYIFDNRDDMILMEKKIVNREFIERKDTYNIILGGGWRPHNGSILVENEIGKRFRVSKDDPDFISGKLKSTLSDFIMAVDSDGNNYRVKKDDPRIISGEIFSKIKGKTLIIDKNGIKKWVSVNDPKFLNGEYKHITKDRVISEETREKFKKIPKDGGKNPMYNRTFVTNIEDGKTIAVSKDDLSTYLQNGFYLGRPKEKTNNQLNTKWIKNDILKKSKQVSLDQLDLYLNDGWSLGRKFY